MFRSATLLTFVLFIAIGCNGSRQESVNGTAPATVRNDPYQAARNDGGTHPPDDTADEGGSNVVISLAGLGIAEEISEVAPSESGWTTEVQSEAAGDQLKRIASLLIRGQIVNDGSLNETVHREFVGTSLVPDETEVVFRDACLEVKRPRRDPPKQEIHGRTELADALHQLVLPLRGATDARYEVKVARVSIQGNSFSTEARFQLSGQTDSKIHQIRMVWQCDWTEPGDGQSIEGDTSGMALLKSIVVLAYEHVIGQFKGQRLLDDYTASVLGNESSFREHLAFGLDHWLGRIEKRHGMVASGWQGLALADVNGDGLDDVYVCQPGGLPNRLYVQRTDGTAQDVSASAGVDWLIHTHGCLLVDLDNDGDQDLIVATVLGLIIMSNDGAGTFTVKGRKFFPEAAPICVCAADFDDDGDLDLYACAYSRRQGSISTQLLGRPVPYHDANNGGRNALFRNDLDWRFRDVTQAVGLRQNNQRFSLAAAWEDYDNDGDMDLYVANDYGRNNLYRNDNGRFRDVAEGAGVEDVSAGMSVSWGDVNNDGWMDLYVSNMWSSAGNRIAYQRQFLAEKAQLETLANFQRHARGNSLFLNGGASADGGFADVSVQAGVTMGRWAWGSRLCDINNDGLQDVLVANGFITQEDPSDL